jgi:hypothetical protein
MAVITLDITVFRQLFAEFASATVYPDAILQARWDNEAISYVSDENCGSLTGTKRAFAIQLMLAHILRLNAIIAAGPGSLTGVVTGATIDKVSVTLQPPPGKDAWLFWLNQTPYGQQLAALLSAQSAGGFYIGGLPERAAFRKVGGLF